ncbi:hypothetical protein SFRURICE_005708 [Spodoptera frugiperda]|nr:hypothetical protein SFRURICE_005708 [Spodoptera frugiperda]
MASVVRSYHRGEGQTMVHPSLEAHLYHFELGLPPGSVVESLGTLNTWYRRTDSIVAIRSARLVTVFQKTSNWLADHSCVAIMAGYLRVDEDSVEMPEKSHGTQVLPLFFTSASSMMFSSSSALIGTSSSVAWLCAPAKMHCKSVEGAAASALASSAGAHSAEGELPTVVQGTHCGYQGALATHGGIQGLAPPLPHPAPQPPAGPPAPPHPPATAQGPAPPPVWAGTAATTAICWKF